MPDDPNGGSKSEYDMVRFTFALVAAAVLAFAGLDLVGIRSVSGDTIIEAGFQGIGYVAWGLAVLSIAVGLRRV